MRYFFRVEYDGREYAGWQTQPSERSVQSVLQEVFGIVTRQPCVITGGGRTDAGVHARGQAAHLDIEGELDIPGVLRSVNAVLPPDIAVRDLRTVDPGFHARFSATSRRYCYHIITRKMPLWHRRAWAIYRPLDWDTMAAHCESLLGRHDFSCFCAAGHSAKTMTCSVTEASFTHENDLHVFTIKADRFLYKMVRSIVGTLVEIGNGRLRESLAEIIRGRDHARAGMTAPAFGLVLDTIMYDEGKNL
jgi:tRNA pseudouridine38-40 synthase